MGACGGGGEAPPPPACVGLAAAAAGVVVALLLRAFVIGSYIVPSGSMLDTIRIGDLLVGEKVTPRTAGVSRGEVVTFESPVQPGLTLVKRVVAVAGQTVDLRDGTLYVDGAAEEGSYTGGRPTLPLDGVGGSAGISYPYVVPDGCVFVMGDNRTDSLDSRCFGPVGVESVHARVVAVYWPPADAGLV